MGGATVWMGQKTERGVSSASRLSGKRVIGEKTATTAPIRISVGAAREQVSGSKRKMSQKMEQMELSGDRAAEGEGCSGNPGLLVTPLTNKIKERRNISPSSQGR